MRGYKNKEEKMGGRIAIFVLALLLICGSAFAMCGSCGSGSACASDSAATADTAAAPGDETGAADQAADSAPAMDQCAGQASCN
jgi:hypothetical protein